MRFFVLLILLSSDFPYREAAPGYKYNFPRDHFEHPNFRTEWWYYTGNVRDASGHRFGFELVFFRQGEHRPLSDSRSAWSLDDLYLAHAALTDIDGKRFLYHERLNRAGPGIAGASSEQHRIWNGNWSSTWNNLDQKLEATNPDFDLSLNLRPLTPPVINGVNGLSRKSERSGAASHYVTLPLLDVHGEVVIGRSKHSVAGNAWMDHEWFTHQLAEDQIGWVWFSIQLENHTELMLFELRRKDGGIDPHSSGTFIGPDGAARHLTSNEFSLKPERTWQRYPVEWQISIPSLHVEMSCKAALDNQELAGETGGPAYWEGAVAFTGSAKGVGYLEMTGYRKPVVLQ